MKKPALALTAIAFTALTLITIHRVLRPPASPHGGDNGRDAVETVPAVGQDRAGRDDPGSLPALDTGRSKRRGVEGEAASPATSLQISELPDVGAAAPIPAGASVEILVLDVVRDQPVPECDIALRPVDGAGTFAGRPTLARSDASGIAALTGLTPGHYMATVGRENGESPRTDGDWFCAPTPIALIAISQHLAITLRVHASARIAGRVVDDRGQPVAGAALGIRVESDETIIESKRGEISDDDGRFALSGIAVSEGFDSLVFAELPEYAERGEALFTCAPAGVVDVGDLVLRGRQSAIVGTLIDAAGSPLAEATVVATSRGSSRLTRQGITGEDGRFRVPALIAGVWDVRTPPYCLGAGGAQTVTVVPDGADLQLGILIAAVGVHRLRGIIVDDAHRPLQGAMVECEYGTTTVGADGIFEIATCTQEGVAVRVRLQDSRDPLATIEHTFVDVPADGVIHRLTLVPTGLLFELEIPNDAPGEQTRDGSTRALELVAEGPRRRWSRMWTEFSGTRLRVPGELQTGAWTFRLTLDGFETVTLHEQIEADLSAQEISLTARFTASDR